MEQLVVQRKVGLYWQR